MGGRKAACALLAVLSAGIAAFAPPGASSLPYDLAGLLSASADPFSQPVQPGEQYPPTLQDRTIPTVPPAGAEPPRRKRPEFALTIDASVTADSNVTNATDARSVVVDYGTGPLPVPLDPNLRQRPGIGAGASAAASAKLPVAAGVAVSLGAEGYVLDYPGSRSDDASALASAGIELSGKSGSGSVQATAFDRWYGGTSAMSGFGLRASWRQDIAPGQHLSLLADARRFESGYGRAFGGTQAGAYLSYDIALDPTLTAAGGVYVRRDWLRDDRFSSTEIGAYGNLVHYLSDGLTGGITAGVSRATFDEPLPFLSPDPRRDWRYYGSLYVTTRHPFAFGITPSLTYTYSRTSSSIGYYSADRHRLRLGLTRGF